MAICSISNEERDSLYQMVYNNFYKASLENKPVDVESYMKELIALISKSANDPLVTEAYTQILPGILSQAAFINNNVTMHLLKNKFDMNFITDKMIAFEDYTKVQSYLGTGKAAQDVIEEEVKSAIEQSNKGELPAGGKLELATAFNYIVDSIFSTTGVQNLVNASTNLGDRVPDPAKQFYYDFILHITNNAQDNDFGYHLTAMPRGGLQTLVNKNDLYDTTANSRADNLVLAVTDENGDIIFFDKQYNVTDKNNGKPIYFPARSGRVAAENIGTRVLTPAQIAERKGITEEKAKEVLDAEIKFMTNLFSYTKANFNKPENWVTVPITGTSLGTLHVDYNQLTPINKVNFVNQVFKPVIIPEKNYQASGQTKTNQVFYINGVAGAIPIISRGISSDIARKLAQLIARPVVEINELSDKRELSVDEKKNLASEFIYMDESGITYEYIKGIGPILKLEGESIDLDNQDAAEEAIYKHLFETFYVSGSEVTKKEIDNGFLEGKKIVKKTSGDKSYLKELGEDVIVQDVGAGKKTKTSGFFKVYRRRLHINAKALGNIDGVFDNFNISLKNGEWVKESNEINYVDYIKDNFFINLPLNKDNEIVGLNGYIKFDPNATEFEKILNYEKQAATAKAKPVKSNKGKKSATTKPAAKKKTAGNPFTKSQIQQKVYHVDKRKGLNEKTLIDDTTLVYSSGAFFTTEKKYAENYAKAIGGVIYEAYVDVQNPYVADKEIIQYLGRNPNELDAGSDSVVHQSYDEDADMYGKVGIEIVVYKPEQIKLISPVKKEGKPGIETENKFDDVNKTLLLDISKSFLPNLNFAEDLTSFDPKAEYHLTVMGFPIGKLIKKAAPEVEQQVKDLISNTNFNVSIKSPLEAYKIKKTYPTQGEVESVIVLAEVPELKAFYEKLSEILGVQLEEPFPHITVYTKGSSFGIGVTSQKDFETLSPQKLTTRQVSSKTALQRVTDLHAVIKNLNTINGTIDIFEKYLKEILELRNYDWNTANPDEYYEAAGLVDELLDKAKNISYELIAEGLDFKLEAQLADFVRRNESERLVKARTEETTSSNLQKGFKLSTDKKGKDQGKADLANALITYPNANTSSYQYWKDAKEQGIPVNDDIQAGPGVIAMVSVNGNNKATDEQITDTILAARDIIEAGGTVIMDSTEDANRSWNQSGEALVQKELGEPTGQTSKGYNYWGSNPEVTQEETPAAEVKPKAVDVINEIIKNDDSEDDELKGLSRNTKQARDFVRQYGLRFDIAKLSPNELKAKLAEAKEWFDKSIFKDRFKLEDLMDEVNTYDPNSVAKWFQNAIILFEGADYSDLYHESWHGFTRMFMTEEQRQELYAKTRKRSGSFRTYKSVYRNFSKASDLEIEEFLAEEFRAFMLSGGKMDIKDVTQRNIFRKILDFFLELFGAQSYNDMLLNQEALTYANDIYDKLQFGRLTEYSYSEQNLPAEMRQQVMNKGAESIDSNYSTPLLTMRNSMELVDTIDSLVSDHINNRIGVTEDGAGAKPYLTVALLSIPKERKAALESARLNIQDAILDLDAQIAKAETDLIKQKLLNKQDALVWAIDNWDLDSDKGIIPYYNKKSRFSDFVSASEKAILFYEDNAEFKSRDGHDRRGNESSLLDLAHESVIYVIKSLHALESDGSKALNNLGFNTLMDFGLAWNRITRILQGSNSPQEMYERLQSSKEDYPFIAELLIKLGNPDVEMSAHTQNLWTQFNDAFNKTRVPLVALVIDRTTRTTQRDEEGNPIAFVYEYNAKVGGASVADAKIGRDWNDRFKVTNTKYILADANGNNFLDIDAIYNDYVSNYSTINRIKFLQDIGIYFDNKSKIVKALNKMVPNPAKILFDRIEAIKTHNDKAIAEGKPKNVVIVRKIDDLINPGKKIRQNGEVLKGLRGLYNSLQRIQANYTDDYSDFMVLNAVGDAQYEFMENNTITQQIRFLQDDPDYNTLISRPEMNHLSAERNPFVSNNPDPKRKRLVTIHELFDMSKTNGPKRSLKEGYGSNEKITIDINNLAGVSFTVNGEASNGIAASDSDEFTKRLTDFHVSVIHGLPMGTTPADKSTILVYHLSNRKYYVNPREFALGTNGEAAAFNILLGYLEAELDRINRVKALPANALERMVPVGKSTYGVEGEKFVIFGDMMKPDLQKELMNIPKEYGGRLRDYLDLPESSDLKKRIADDVIKVYFANKVNEFTEKLRDAEYIDDTMHEKVQEIYAGNDPKAKKLSRTETRNIAIKTHVYNSFIHNVETVLLYHGDPALFNMAKEEFQKRNAGINSGGIIPRTDAAMARYLNQHVFAPTKASYQNSAWYTGQSVDKAYGDQFRSAVLEDVETVSLYYKAIEDDIRTSIKKSPGYKNGNLSDKEVETIVSERAKPYREMKEGDGQGWITFDGYKAISIMMGAWSDAQELLYRDVLAKKVIDQAKIKEFFPVLKMQYWGPLATNGLPLTAFHKFSLAPLVPSTIKGTDLEKLHNKMVEQKVDYALFGSGSKVSTITPNGKPDKFYKNPGDAQNRELAFTEEGYTFTPNDIFLKYFKKQLEIAPKYKGKTTFPTQLRKLIESGLMSNGVPTDFMEDMPKEVRIAEWAKLDEDKKLKNKNYELLKRFQGNLQNLMAQKKQELLDEIGWTYVDGKPTGSLDKLFAYIESQLTKREMAEHHLDFVKLNKEGKLKSSLDVSLAAAEIEKVLVSIINKKLIKQKVTGEALVQVSSAGYTNREFFDANKGLSLEERLEVLGSNDLPFYRQQDGKTMAMKIKLGIQGEYKKLLDLPEVKEMVMNSIRAGKEITHLEALNQLIKSKEWLNKGDNRKFISLAGVRIPVQSINSMEFMEVYEFLPEGSNQIILPSEIVAKSGGDFDIDKLTTMMYSLTKNEDGSLSIKDDYQNNVITDMIDILSSERTYIDLITPNATDIVLPIAQELASKVRPYDPMQNVFSERGGVISGTRIFEIEYNIYKHGSNSIGKATLGQGAIDNTYNVIFNTVGAYLEPSYEIGVDKDGLPIMKPQEIYLNHNTLLTPKGTSISLSDLYDADGIHKISDVISQLINGWVDIAKDPWIFDIQGNNFVAPSLLLMVQAGVPIKDAAYFASQPIIRQYINEVKKAKSAYAGPLGIELDNPNFFRSEARRKMLLNFSSMAEYITTDEETGESKLYTNSIKTAAIDLTKPFKDKVFNLNYFKDHLQDELDFNSDEQLAMLLHFLDIEDMSKVITTVKRTTNLDTQVASTLFETNLRAYQANELREDKRLGEDVVNRILDDSSISSFGISDFMSEIYKNLFTIRDSKLVNDYLLKKLGTKVFKKNVADTYNDQDVFITNFRNDLVMFMFQNYMRNLDLDSIKYYKSLQVASTPIKLKPTVASPVSVFVRDIKLKSGATSPMMYFDKEKLVEEFANLQANSGKENINITNPDLPFEFGIIRSSMFQNIREYGRYVMEREFLRHSMNLTDVKSREDYVKYKNDFVNSKYEEFTDEELDSKAALFAYENTLRDMALDNTFNQYYILKSPTKSYAKRLLDIKQNFPELVEKYKVLDFLTADEAKTKERVIKFKSSKLDADRINRFHEELLELTDEFNLIETANMTKFQAREMAKFFNNLPIYTMFTTGFNSKGEYGIGQIMPDIRLTPILESMLDYMSKNDLTTWNLVNTYFNKFSTVNSYKNTASRYKVKNYTLDQPLWKASKNPKADLTGSFATISTFRDNYQSPSYLVQKGEDIKEGANKLLKDRSTYLFVFNGASNPESKPLETNDSIFALSQEHTNVFGLTTKLGFQDVVSQQMTDANYDDNIKAIENSIQALKKAAKPFKGKIFWNAAGYGQSMIGADLNGENVNQKRAKATKTFVYLSKRLYEEFGYKNKNYEVVAPRKFIRVTRNDVLENIKKCL